VYKYVADLLFIFFYETSGPFWGAAYVKT